MARQQRTLNQLLSQMADEIDASCGPPASSVRPVTAPIWTPLGVVCSTCSGQTFGGGHLCEACGAPLQRGIVMPDGRRLSPQQAAIESEADELFFGGGPGGGKSQVLIGLALTQHRNSIIFRREYTQLTGADGLMTTAERIVGLHDRLNQNRHMFEHLPGDRKLEFGATGSRLNEWLKKRGRPHDLKSFDELTEIPEQAYRLLIAWLRTSDPLQRTRVVSTGNPPLTSDGEWVIRYFAPWLDPKHPRQAKPGELRWYVVIDDKDREVDDGDPRVLRGRPDCPHEIRPHMTKCPGCDAQILRPRSRTFIPSGVEDNPYYLRTGYADVLAGLTGPLSAMGSGEFSAAIQDDSRQVIPTAWVLAAQARWTKDGGAERPLSQVGVDPSWGGADEFVIAKRHGPWVAPLITHGAKAAPDGPTGAALVARAVPGKQTRVQIDSESAGASVKDSLVGLGYGRVIALKGSRGSKAKDKTGELEFANARAEWHWKLREILDPTSGEKLALPPDSQLRADLCAARWEVTIHGIRIELKEKIVARIGRSPDRGEAVMYAVVPAGVDLATSPTPTTVGERDRSYWDGPE